MQPTRIIRNALEIPMAASVARVWHALTEETDAWWREDFYLGRGPGRMRLEAEIGGRLYEEVDDGSALVWYNVVSLEPGGAIGLAGQFSPPLSGPAHASLELSLEPISLRETLFRLSETVSGVIDGDLQRTLLDGWSSLFEDGLGRYAEAHRPRRPARRQRRWLLAPLSA